MELLQNTTKRVSCANLSASGPSSNLQTVVSVAVYFSVVVISCLEAWNISIESIVGSAHVCQLVFFSAIAAVAFKIARAYDQATNAHLNCAEIEKDMKSYPC